MVFPANGTPICLPSIFSFSRSLEPAYSFASQRAYVLTASQVVTVITFHGHSSTGRLFALLKGPSHNTQRRRGDRFFLSLSPSLILGAFNSQDADPIAIYLSAAGPRLIVCFPSGRSQGRAGSRSLAPWRCAAPRQGRRSRRAVVCRNPRTLARLAAVALFGRRRSSNRRS